MKTTGTRISLIKRLIFTGFAALCSQCLFAEPAAPPSGSVIRNVLFIVSDDLKASVLGCYGDQVCKTPNIDELASQGMVFNRAYCQGMACGPSRRSFMAGRYLDTVGASLGEQFKNNGFYTDRVGIGA